MRITQYAVPLLLSPLGNRTPGENSFTLITTFIINRSGAHGAVPLGNLWPNHEILSSPLNLPCELPAIVVPCYHIGSDSTHKVGSFML